MQRRLLPLNALRTFDACARHMSFRKAAEELSVSTSAVSRQIAVLEGFLGFEVFHRRIRQVEITELGRQLHQTLSRALDDVSRSLDDVILRARDSAATPRPFRVRVLTTLAMRLVVPNLRRFELRYPDVDVALTILGSFEGKDQSSCDLDLAYTKDVPADDRSILFREKAMMVCSPAFAQIANIRPPLTPSEIVRLRIIGSTPDMWDWKAWCAWAGIPWPGSPTLTVADIDHLAIEAALGGAGVSLAESRFITNELADGRLVRLCSGEMFEIGYYTAEIVSREREDEATAFRDWLIQICTNAAHRADRVLPPDTVRVAVAGC